MSELQPDRGDETAGTITLAQALIRLDTVNPPGQEAMAADLVAKRLRDRGIAVQLHALGSERASLVARIGPVGEDALCLCGHLDTVALGTTPWSFAPHGGTVEGDRLLGRGASDMKGGVAAMITAFERVARDKRDTSVALVLCASEETGCQGAASVAAAIGPVGAMVIAEPTSGEVAVAHKGVLWVRLATRGKAAHASMPHLGANAVDTMARALVKLQSLNLEASDHPLLGSPTRNVGSVAGGLAANIVPDRCEALVDVRLTPNFGARAALDAVERCVGPEVTVSTELALDAVATDPRDPWLQSVMRRRAEVEGRSGPPVSVPYFTDASVLIPALGNPPVAIVGPGDPALAHQVDEWCSVAAIERASRLYERLARDWVRPAPHT